MKSQVTLHCTRLKGDGSGGGGSGDVGGGGVWYVWGNIVIDV